MFVIAIPLVLIFSYFWAVIIYRLFGTDSKRDKIIRAVIYIAVAFLVFGGWGVLVDICIFLWIRDFKKKTSYYHARHLLGKAAFGLSIPVFAFSAWQLEVPQKLVFKTFTTLQPYPKYEIMPLEVKNDTNASFVDKVSSFRLKNMDKKLPCGLISFYCNIRSIYYSDENIKDFELVKIYGAYFARSNLFNAFTIYDASAYEYYGNSDFNEIKKLINKQGEDNVAKWCKIKWYKRLCFFS